jgi:hypothetical protein
VEWIAHQLRSPACLALAFNSTGGPRSVRLALLAIFDSKTALQNADRLCEPVAPHISQV